MSEDAALLRKLSGADRDAFAQVYDRHAALVYGIAKRLLGNSAQAEDVTQSVFLQLWTRPSTFRGGNFVAWLATVARNAAIDVLRGAEMRTREPQMPLELASPVDLDDEIAQRMLEGQVADALQALPPEQREPIERAYFEGLSYREVAEKLGMPLGTIKSRIRAGLRRMYLMLREAGVP